VTHGRCGDIEINLSLADYMTYSGRIGGIVGAAIGFMPAESAILAGQLIIFFGLFMNGFDIARQGSMSAICSGYWEALYRGNNYEYRL
jgi:hypothetical protein